MAEKDIFNFIDGYVNSDIEIGSPQWLVVCADACNAFDEVENEFSVHVNSLTDFYEILEDYLIHLDKQKENSNGD